MKEGYKEWFGKTIELTGEAAIRWLEGAVSEGYSAPADYLPGGGPNLFGRTPKYAVASKLDFVAGLGATGLRAAAFLPADALASQAGQLSTLSRQHSSLVVHMTTQAWNASAFDQTAGHSSFAALAGTGAFQLLATNAQEALDFAIISHKIAELALIPGVNAMDIWPTAVEPQAIDCPTKEMLIQFLGSSDDQIACPTPAQEMLFGKKRRRVPNWFNLDFPALNGARKDEPAISLESAAQQRYFYHHLPAIVAQVMGEYSRLAGRDYAPVMAYRAEDADYLVLTMGAAFASAKAAVDYLRSQEKARVGCLNLSLFRPFPAEMLAGLLDGK
ncbi:MAG: hypothetical protein KDD02_10320, partial [Phaeodactylibacter sp.]|nr:hypothetical protein [Phaeodactylibacter sp.]